MSSRLLPIPMRNPGHRGLVVDQASGVQGPEWALKATNAVIDENRRLAARKGWALLTAGAPHSDDTEAMHEFVVSSTVTHIVSAADDGLWSGTTSLTDRGNSAGTLTTPTAADWQLINYNGKCLGWQAGHAPIVWDPTHGTYPDDFLDLVESDGTAPAGNAAVATHGRIFAVDADGQTVKWCGLLDETKWASGGAGSLDLRNVWVGGVDIVVALAVWSEQLVIFGQRQILLFSGLSDPNSSLKLSGATDSPSSSGIEDTITAAGLAARDAVVSVGTDLIYLSPTGLRSLARGIQFSTLPLTTLAPQVRSQITSQVTAALDAGSPIRMVYHQPLGAVLARIGSSYWYFDVRDLGAVAACPWVGVDWKSALSTRTTLYLGVAGGIAEYDGYQDGRSSYVLEWLTPWMPVAQAHVFVLKRVLMYLEAGLGYAVDLRWAWDYSGALENESRTLQVPPAAEWGEGEFGVDEWGPANVKILQPYDAGGEGELLQIGCRVVIDGGKFAIQEVKLLGKRARVQR